MSIRHAMAAIASSLVGFVIIAGALFFPTQSRAQIGLPGFEHSLSIRMNPLHPSPGDTVSLKVVNIFLDLPKAEIVWRSDGKILAQGRGVDTADIIVGPLGSETVVEVFATTQDGNASGRIVIIPTELDLLVDSDAYTPPFYRGRALPSVGTTVHLEARPHFILKGGARIPSSDIIFAWRKNGEIISDLTGRGKKTALIPIQHLYGNDRISVEAYTEDHLFSNAATIALTPKKPVVMLYQDHPLYGVMYHRAIDPVSTFTQNEVTFAAVPYFSQATSANDPSLTLQWKVNGDAIPSSASNPSGITINADNSSGIALLQLHTTHKTNYFFDSENSWNITLSSRQDMIDGVEKFGI